MTSVEHRTHCVRRVILVSALAVCSVAGRVIADDVHMKNGQTFEDVIAYEEGAGVRIRVAFGEITVPRSSVARIVRSESAVDEYLTRRSELEQAGAAAMEWLELAQWALREEVGHGAREAALRVARLDPELEGLAPLLRSLGYYFSEERREWLSADDYQRSLGYVRSGGEWVSPAEIAERERLARLAAEERRAAQAAAREDRLAQAVELLTLQQLAEQTRPPEPPAGVPLGQTVGLPIAIFPGYHPRPVHGTVHRAPRYSSVSVFGAPYGLSPAYEDPPYALDILERIPGSLFPIRSDRRPLHPTRRH